MHSITVYSISRGCVVNSIELDDDQSDAESTDSAAEAFANIPLPSASVSAEPRASSAAGSAPTLDAIPLPKSPAREHLITNNRAAASSSANVASKADMATKADGSPISRGGDAVHAKTSIGTITVLLNRKLGPRLSKASVFDVPDDNAKEVNRKLLKLRRLKRMKKSGDGQNEPESGSATGRKALQQRISEWKEELLNDQNFKSKRRDTKGALVAATSNVLIGDSKDKQSNAVDEGHITEAIDAPVPPLMALGSKSEVVDSKLVPSLKSSDDSYMMKLYDSFMKVTSSNDLAQLDWPREMIQETKLAPKLVYSCNPLYFSFRKLQLISQQNGESRPEAKKHKHQKKRKKKTEESAAGSKSGVKNENDLDTNKDKTESRKTSKSDSANLLAVAKGHTKMAKTISEPGVRNKKTKKSAAPTGKPTKSKTSAHSAQSDKRKHSVAEGGTSQKRVLGSRSPNTRSMVVDGDVSRLSSALKDTGKSRWDTSSDSEVETSQPVANDRGTRTGTRSRMPVSSDQNRAKNRRSSPDDHSRSQSHHWSSDSSARSHKRSRYRSASSAASSYSRSSSSYRSSSYSYRRRRRLTYDSSRSSSSYSDTGSNYSHSSRSYSRSRSSSRRRHSHSRSYSRSRSSSMSCSPRHHRSGSRLRSYKARSDWQTQMASKRPHIEPSVTLHTKPSTHPTKVSSSKSKTSTVIEAKNSSNTVEPAIAPAEPTGDGGSSAEVKELNPSVNTEEPVPTEAVNEDVKSIPTPEEHMESIPLPVPQHPSTSTSNQSFIGPVLPSNHPLAHKQDIPLPPTAKFQRIGPNDPLVFRRMPPPPPPPASLTSPSTAGSATLPPPRPPSPPAEDMDDDIAGDEDPIPQILDVRTFEPASFIPPEQDEQYGALRRQAERHARRQRIREETGMDIDEESEDENTEGVPDEQLANQAYLNEAVMFSTTPVLHVPQQHLVGQPLSTSVAMMASGTGLVPVQMVPAGSGGLVGLEPSLVSLVQQGQTSTVLAVSPAAAALARAQEEAEAEAQVRQQVAAAQAIAAAQRQRAAELVQLLPSPIGVGAAIRPAALSLQTVPVHALASQQPQQQLLQLPGGRIIGVPNVIPGSVQVVAQPQAQPAPLLIGPNGTLLRLIR